MREMDLKYFAILENGCIDKRSSVKERVDLSGYPDQVLRLFDHWVSFDDGEVGCYQEIRKVILTEDEKIGCMFADKLERIKASPLREYPLRGSIKGKLLTQKYQLRNGYFLLVGDFYMKDEPQVYRPESF